MDLGSVLDELRIVTDLPCESRVRSFAGTCPKCYPAYGEITITFYRCS